MISETTIKVGDNVRVIVEVWAENEVPTVTNFYTGKITEIIQRTQHAFWVKILFGWLLSAK